MAQFICKCGEGYDSIGNWRKHYDAGYPDIAKPIEVEDIKKVKEYDKKHGIDIVKCCEESWDYETYRLHYVSQH